LSGTRLMTSARRESPPARLDGRLRSPPRDQDANQRRRRLQCAAEQPRACAHWPESQQERALGEVDRGADRRRPAWQTRLGLVAIGLRLTDEVLMLSRLARQRRVPLRPVAPLTGALGHATPPLGSKVPKKLGIHPRLEQRGALRRSGALNAGSGGSPSPYGTL